MKLWSHGTSSAVIDTQLKEWDKIIFAKSSLISFVGYSEKINFVNAYTRVPIPPRGGYSPIKVTGVLVVPFRGLNLWIGTA